MRSKMVYVEIGGEYCGIIQISANILRKLKENHSTGTLIRVMEQSKALPQLMSMIFIPIVQKKKECKRN